MHQARTCKLCRYYSAKSRLVSTASLTKSRYFINNSSHAVYCETLATAANTEPSSLCAACFVRQLRLDKTCYYYYYKSLWRTQNQQSQIRDSEMDADETSLRMFLKKLGSTAEADMWFLDKSDFPEWRTVGQRFLVNFICLRSPLQVPTPWSTTAVNNIASYVQSEAYVYLQVNRTFLPFIREERTVQFINEKANCSSCIVQIENAHIAFIPSAKRCF